ncbi:crossover junction endonuclease EME1 isoform 1-T2 [Discoglossus pictus]
MSSLSDLSDSEELPPAPFQTRRVFTTCQPNVMVLSSDSDEEDSLMARIARPQPLPVTRDTQPRPLGAVTARNSAPRPPTRDQPGVSQPKKRGKDLEQVTVRIDPGLLQGGCGGQVLSALQTQEMACEILPQVVPRSITWSRTVWDVQGAGSSLEEAEIIIFVPVEEFVSMIQTSSKESFFASSKETLRGFVTRVTASRAGKVPTLVVMELEKYFRGNKNQSKKRMQEAVRGEKAPPRKKKGVKETLPVLSRVEVEEVLIDVELHTGVHVWFLETWKEFADFVCMFTKAVTEAPNKRQRENSNFSFYLDGEWAGGMKVDRCGKGLLEVWRRQFQQFNRVSVEIANAVVAAYPSPQLLVQAYHDCHTESQCHNLLSDILVRRGEGVTSTSRRVGPELSKRIYQQLMTLEPELSLELS